MASLFFILFNRFKNCGSSETKLTFLGNHTAERRLAQQDVRHEKETENVDGKTSVALYF